MSEIGQNIWTGLKAASWLDQLNLVLGLLGVGLMIRRSLWAFPVGLAAVSVQGVLFYRTAFPADALRLHVNASSLATGAADVNVDGRTDVVDVTDLGLDRFDAEGRSRLDPDPIALPFPERT